MFAANIGGGPGLGEQLLIPSGPQQILKYVLEISAQKIKIMKEKR